MKINLLFFPLLFFFIELSAKEIKFEPLIVQPGFPGAASKIIDAETAIDIADTAYTRDDIIFLQQMIPHHEQAILLSSLVSDRTNSVKIIDLAQLRVKIKD